MEHDAGTHLPGDQGLLINDDGEGQTHGTSKSAPDHRNRLPPVHRGADHVQRYPEYAKHEGTDHQQGDVKHQEPPKVTRMDVTQRVEYSVREQQARQKENDCVSDEFHRLPNSFHGLQGHEPWPSEVCHCKAGGYSGENSAGTQLALGHEEGQVSAAKRGNDLNQCVVVKALFCTLANNEHRSQTCHLTENDGGERHVTEEGEHSRCVEGRAEHHLEHQSENDDCRSVVHQALARH
mmetsp:Transcript_56523/g.105993  ORF Transcript_56523/g.105993 Transcript_56523/m.105993 type:complete len:236 (+) Transcript_56523:986-1693(+)